MEMQMSGKTKGSVNLSDDTFAVEYNEGLVHQVVTAHMAGARQGSKAQKNRSDVSGGGIKPWRQKGTGRARAGTIRSPIWTGGGVTFAARPRDYSQKVNRKMYRKAIAVILSELVRQERLKVVKELTLAEPKTKLLITVLKELDLDNVMIVTAEEDRNLSLASRNLPHVSVCQVQQLDPVTLVGFGHILFTEAALKNIEEKLS